MACAAQDNVSDDMIGLSGRLLANVRAMQGAVQSREGLLNQTEAAQDVSKTNADYAVKTSKNIKNRYAHVQRFGFASSALYCRLFSVPLHSTKLQGVATAYGTYCTACSKHQCASPKLYHVADRHL